VSVAWPAPGVGKSVELRLAHPAARLAEKGSERTGIVVVGVGVKGRVEVDEIDTRIRELAPVAQPLQIVAEVQPIH